MNNNLKKINIYAIYLGAIILILPLIAFFINAFSFRWFYPQVIPKELSLQAWVRLKLIPKPDQRTFEGFIELWASNPAVIKALLAVSVTRVIHFSHNMRIVLSIHTRATKMNATYTTVKIYHLIRLNPEPPKTTISI